MISDSDDDSAAPSIYNHAESVNGGKVDKLSSDDDSDGGGQGCMDLDGAESFCSDWWHCFRDGVSSDAESVSSAYNHAESVNGGKVDKLSSDDESDDGGQGCIEFFQQITLNQCTREFFGWNDGLDNRDGRNSSAPPAAPPQNEPNKGWLDSKLEEMPYKTRMQDVEWAQEDSKDLSADVRALCKYLEVRHAISDFCRFMHCTSSRDVTIHCSLTGIGTLL